MKKKNESVVRWVAGSNLRVEIWLREPFLVGCGLFTGRLKANRMVQELDRDEFRKFYPNIPCPKPGECFEVTFK